MSTAVRPLDPAKAVGVSKQLLERLERRIGRIPAVVLLVANSSAALRGYLSLFGALRSGGLAARLCEQIALRVSELNGSEYGVAEHAEFARELGLSEREIRDARLGRSPTPKLQAGLAFAEAVVASRGHVSDADLARVRAAGYTDGQIVEIVAQVALNTFVNHLTNASRLPASAARRSTVPGARLSA